MDVADLSDAGLNIAFRSASGFARTLERPRKRIRAGVRKKPCPIIRRRPDLLRHPQPVFCIGKPSEDVHVRR